MFVKLSMLACIDVCELVGRGGRNGLYCVSMHGMDTDMNLREKKAYICMHSMMGVYLSMDMP